MAGQPVDASILASINLKSFDMFMEQEVKGALMVHRERLKPVIAVVGNPEKIGRAHV